MTSVDKRSNLANLISCVFNGLLRYYPRNRRFRMEKLIDIMEDDDDVQNVWHNWEE